jgi:hypothetical protein
MEQNRVAVSGIESWDYHWALVYNVGSVTHESFVENRVDNLPVGFAALG